MVAVQSSLYSRKTRLQVQRIISWDNELRLLLFLRPPFLPFGFHFWLHSQPTHTNKVAVQSSLLSRKTRLQVQRVISWGNDFGIDFWFHFQPTRTYMVAVQSSLLSRKTRLQVQRLSRKTRQQVQRIISWDNNFGIDFWFHFQPTRAYMVAVQSSLVSRKTRLQVQRVISWDNKLNLPLFLRPPFLTFGLDFCFHFQPTQTNKVAVQSSLLSRKTRLQVQRVISWGNDFGIDFWFHFQPTRTYMVAVQRSLFSRKIRLQVQRIISWDNKLNLLLFLRPPFLPFGFDFWFYFHLICT
uniref:Uncharacterized protein n=1 Tax=Salix viminalis TaxID=40686 RepID=A0A6N2NGF7_SALVM